MIKVKRRKKRTPSEILEELEREAIDILSIGNTMVISVPKELTNSDPSEYPLGETMKQWVQDMYERHLIESHIETEQDNVYLFLLGDKKWK